jgi:glycosyltransferase involved in cell wall biosynthesis
MSNPEVKKTNHLTSRMIGWVLIPARDEAERIAGVLGQLGDFSPRVLVVADNCRDQTALIVRQAGACVIERRGTGGKGMALRYGWSWLAEREDCDFVLLLDGDGQHEATEAVKFVEAWREHGAELIIGRRAPFQSPMPWLRRCCNGLMSWLVSRKVGQTVRDSQCGFRLLGRRLFSLPDWRAENFEIETEIILRAREIGAKIVEVPICTRYAAEQSRISAIRDSLRWLWFMLRR